MAAFFALFEAFSIRPTVVTALVVVLAFSRPLPQFNFFNRLDHHLCAYVGASKGKRHGAFFWIDRCFLLGDDIAFIQLFVVNPMQGDASI